MREKVRINKLLYRDGMRQLRLVGIMGLVVFSLEAILMAVGFYLTARSEYLWNTSLGSFAIEPRGVSLYSVHWIMVTAIFILTPLMTIMLFNFLDRRNASDFYHSIPDTRGTLYFSYVAAIMTWIAAIVVGTTLLSVAAIAMVPGYYVIWDDVPRNVFIVLSGCVLMMGGILIARSLTGTRMSNMLVALMVLFLPRLYITVFVEVLSDMLGFVAWEYSSGLYNVRYNIVAGSTIGIFSYAFGFGNNNPLTHWSSGIYSLILGLVYVVIGYVIFLRRKSESAGQAAVSRRLQTLFRLVVAMTICLIPIAILVTSWEDSTMRYWTDGDWFLLVVIYIVAILSYFIYELMTTGKLRRFGKLCAGLLILAIMNAACFGGFVGAYYAVAANCPTEEKIRSVTILSDQSDYFGLDLSEIRIEDEEVIAITAQALARTVEQSMHGYETVRTIEEAESMNTMPATGEYAKVLVETVAGSSRPAEDAAPQVRVRRTVAIRTAMQTLYRDVIYTGEEWTRVTERLATIPEYCDMFLTLPELGDDIWVSSYSGWIDDRDAEEIYKVMREEVKELDFIEWYLAVTGVGSSYRDYMDSIHLQVYHPELGRSQYVNLPILDSMTRTIECYFARINRSETLEEDGHTWSMMKEALDDGMIESENAHADYASFSMTLYLLEDDWSVRESRHYNLAGYRVDENTWETEKWNGDSERQRAMSSLLDRVFAGELEQEPVAGNKVMLRMEGYLEYVANNDWHSGNLSRAYCIFLENGVPEELEALLGMLE